MFLQKHVAFNIDPRDPAIAVKIGNHVPVIETNNQSKPAKQMSPASQQ